MTLLVINERFWMTIIYLFVLEYVPTITNWAILLIIPVDRIFFPITSKVALLVSISLALPLLFHIYM